MPSVVISACSCAAAILCAQFTQDPDFAHMKKNKTQKPRSEKTRVGRRNFVKLLPALGAASLVASKLPLEALAQTPSPTPAPRITKEMMHQAEKLIGIELSDAQEAMALGGVNRNLDPYE